MGLFIGILLLVKHFDLYQKEHMLHHSPKKLLTQEDEFTTFILNLCGLEPGLSKRELWRRVLLSFGSPFFHLRFLLSRISSCLLSRSTLHNLVAIAVWAGLIAAAVHSGLWAEFAIAWLLPLVVLFQIATALRTLCEHRFPDASVIAARGKQFVGLATAGDRKSTRLNSVTNAHLVCR